MNSTSFCESLFGLLLPSLYASIRLGGLNSFQELITRLNHSVSMANWPTKINQSSSANPNYFYQQFLTNPAASGHDYFNLLAAHPCDYHQHLEPPNDSFSSLSSSSQLNLSNLSSPMTTNLTNPLRTMMGSGSNHPHTTADLPMPIRCTLIYNYTLDLANYFQICNQIESNLVYFEWLLGLFMPLIYALCLMFVLPSVVVILLYASSLFMFLTKHWNKLKVS